MIDREKLIKDIEKQMSEPTNDYVVLWFSEAKYVLDLLKEQDAVEPNPVHNSNRWFACGKCDCSITIEDKFCPRCGRRVKWE